MKASSSLNTSLGNRRTTSFKDDYIISARIILMWGILSHYACVNSSAPANSREICLSLLSAEPVTHKIGNLKSRDDILPHWQNCSSLVTTWSVWTKCSYFILFPFILLPSNASSGRSAEQCSPPKFLHKLPPKHSCISHAETFTNL